MAFVMSDTPMPKHHCILQPTRPHQISVVAHPFFSLLQQCAQCCDITSPEAPPAVTVSQALLWMTLMLDCTAEAFSWLSPDWEFLSLIFFLWLLYGFWKSMEGRCHLNSSYQVFMLPHWMWALITWLGGSLGYWPNFILQPTLASSHLKDWGIMFISKTIRHPPQWLGVVLHGRPVCFLPFLF